MTNSRLSPQEHLLMDQINAIAPDAYERLEEIELLNRDQADRIVDLIVQFCCDAQHIGGIIAGRNAFKRLPREWVSLCLPSSIQQTLNLDDVWNYRRLLELLSEAKDDLLHTYIAKGLQSSDPDINEVAIDFERRK